MEAIPFAVALGFVAGFVLRGLEAARREREAAEALAALQAAARPARREALRRASTPSDN